MNRKRMVRVFIIVIVLVLNLTSVVHAAVIENNTAQTNKVIFNPITADQYSDAIFKNLSAAKGYFGYDLTYGYCNNYYMGTTYNAFYWFSDATKQYFRVVYMDEDPVLSNPEQISKD